MRWRASLVKDDGEALAIWSNMGEGAVKIPKLCRWQIFVLVLLEIGVDLSSRIVPAQEVKRNKVPGQGYWLRPIRSIAVTTGASQGQSCLNIAMSWPESLSSVQ